ncbi:hypothetical protein [Ferrovibrio sp.]|uniref:hypothetical protein n=1 Tax=Ferrovibrio sp. TaxID=1917215 RepID=UPI00351537D6
MGPCTALPHVPPSLSRPPGDPGDPGHSGQPARRRQVDWQRGARLLAGGMTVEAVAAALGIAEERLWRHLDTSRLMRRRIRQRLQEQRVP